MRVMLLLCPKLRCPFARYDAWQWWQYPVRRWDIRSPYRLAAAPWRAMEQDHQIRILFDDPLSRRSDNIGLRPDDSPIHGSADWAGSPIFSSPPLIYVRGRLLLPVARLLVGLHFAELQSINTTSHKPLLCSMRAGPYVIHARRAGIINAHGQLSQLTGRLVASLSPQASTCPASSTARHQCWPARDQSVAQPFARHLDTIYHCIAVRPLPLPWPDAWRAVLPPKDVRQWCSDHFSFCQPAVSLSRSCKPVETRLFLRHCWYVLRLHAWYRP